MDATPFLIDVFEPMEIDEFLSSHIPIERFPLNSHGLLDFCWATDHKITIERKSASDLIGSMIDGSLEERLKLGLKNADEIALLSEGIMTPDKKGVVVWCETKDKRFFFKHRLNKISYLEIMAFFYRLDKEGVTVYQTPTLDATCKFLLAAYNNSKKDEHLTFRRYLRAKPHTLDQDPYMQNIMSIMGIGVEWAKELLTVYETPWAIYHAGFDELVEIVGEIKAKQIWKGIGRSE